MDDQEGSRARVPDSSRAGGESIDTEDTAELSPATELVVRDAIEHVVGEVLPNASEEERTLIAERLSTHVVTVVSGVSERFSGPLPHPMHLRGYEEICPGAAARVLAMAEKSQDHIIATESRHLDYEFRDRKRGMWLGAALFALLITSALVSALTDHEVVAGFFLTAALISGVSVFVKGRGRYYPRRDASTSDNEGIEQGGGDR